MRDIVFDALGDEYVNLVLRLEMQKIFDLGKQFQSDKDLRVSSAEVLLAAILWIEAGRPPQEIFQDCPHEIKCQLVHVLNRFGYWFSQKFEYHKEDKTAHNMATAWIHLFAEFLKDLENYSQKFWWKPKPTPYSSSCS